MASTQSTSSVRNDQLQVRYLAYRTRVGVSGAVLVLALFVATQSAWVTDGGSDNWPIWSFWGKDDSLASSTCAVLAITLITAAVTAIEPYIGLSFASAAMSAVLVVLLLAFGAQQRGPSYGNRTTGAMNEGLLLCALLLIWALVVACTAWGKRDQYLRLSYYRG